MGLGLLGIAKGAFTVGQKIFAGVKKRREARIEKKAIKLNESRNRLEEAGTFFGGGLINPSAGLGSISGAGNALAFLKGDNVEPQSGAQAVANQNSPGGMGGMNPLILIGVGLAVLFLIMKRR